MAKEKETVELRPVDENEDDSSRVFRLHEDAIEEVAEPEPIRIGEAKKDERFVARLRDDLKHAEDLDEVELAGLAEGLESEWDKETGMRSIPWGWFMLIGLVFAGGILWSLTQVTQSTEKLEEVIVETEELLKKDEDEELEAERMIAAIEEAVIDYYDSRSIEEMLGYVRHPERVKPLMERYYGNSAPVPMRVLGISSMDPLTIENHATFWLVKVQLRDGEGAQVLVEVLEDGSAQVDWETAVCYQPIAWDEFAEKRPAGYTGDFRVYVDRDNFYAYEFADGERYACYRLTALNSDRVLFGYVERGSALMNTMNQLIDQNRGATPLLLRLTVPSEGHSTNGLIVEGIISARWLFVTSPEVEK